MTTFSYIARSATGERITGRLAGSNEQAVLAELQARALAPVQVKPVREARSARKRISLRRLATAYRQLADLLRAGVPLLRALRLMGKSRANPKLATVMNGVADAVADGGHFADALAANPEIFPPVQVAMIRAGERGGFLEDVLARLGRFLEHQADMRGRVLGNLIYPAVLMCVMLGVVIFALVYLVPKFQDFYSRMELPLPTKILLGASWFLTNYWLYALLAVAAIILVLWQLLRRPEVRRQVAIWQMGVPKLGALARDIAVARFARVLGTLLENGIPMLSAMQIARDAAGNILLAEAIEQAAEAVRTGETLAEPLGASGLFSDDAIEIISVGESANNLPEVLRTLADTIEQRVDRMLTAFVRLMEPALLLVMGGLVFFLFLALVVPMLRMSAAI